MSDVMVKVPGELIDQLGHSALARFDDPERVRVALAIHLFISGQVSLGRSAELAGLAFIDFQSLLHSLNIPHSIYDEEERARDQRAIELLRERLSSDSR